MACVARHFGNCEQPQNAWPAFWPWRATRRTIGALHCGQTGITSVLERDALGANAGLGSVLAAVGAVASGEQLPFCTALTLRRDVYKRQMLDFCAEHHIVSEIELIPIQNINEAYERMLRSDVKYRFVIDMASLPEPATA